MTHATTDVPDLAIVLALTSGGPYEAGDAISVAFVSPRVGRLVPHVARPAADVPAAAAISIPESISVRVSRAAGPFVRDAILVLSFVDPHVARIHVSDIDAHAPAAADAHALHAHAPVAADGHAPHAHAADGQTPHERAVAHDAHEQHAHAPVVAEAHAQHAHAVAPDALAHAHAHAPVAEHAHAPHEHAPVAPEAHVPVAAEAHVPAAPGSASRIGFAALDATGFQGPPTERVDERVASATSDDRFSDRRVEERHAHRRPSELVGDRDPDDRARRDSVTTGDGSHEPGVIVRLDWNPDRVRRFIGVVDKLFTVDRLGWYRHALAMRLLVPDQIACGDSLSTMEAMRHLHALRAAAVETLGRPLLAAFMPNFSVTPDWLASLDSVAAARALAGLRDAILPHLTSGGAGEARHDGAWTVGCVTQSDLLGAPATSVEALLPAFIADRCAHPALTERLGAYRQTLLDVFAQTAHSVEAVRLNQMTQPNHSLDDRLWQLVGAVGESFGGLAVA